MGGYVPLLSSFAPVSRFDLMRSLGTCWFVHEHVKYEFNLQFEVPVTYPETAPEIEIPSLDGKTAKIYRFLALRAAVAPVSSWSSIECLTGEAKYARASTSSLCGAKTSLDSGLRIVPKAFKRNCMSVVFTFLLGLALGLGPWLATEVPELVSTGIIVASASGAAGGAAAKP
jgi:hypothetical protein